MLRLKSKVTPAFQTEQLFFNIFKNWVLKHYQLDLEALLKISDADQLFRFWEVD